MSPSDKSQRPGRRGSGLPSRRDIHQSGSASLSSSARPTAKPTVGRKQSSVSAGRPVAAKSSTTGRRVKASAGAAGSRGGGRGGSSIWKKLGIGLVFLILVMVIVSAGAFLTAYAMIKVPAPGEFALAQKTTVYYSDGATEMGTFAEVDRTVIDASTLPKYVGYAVVASEDRSFYTNSGIDLKGIGRAIINNLAGGARQGGSTLSQQYVERYYLDTTTSYLGKLKEAILALKINRQQSKDEILGNYLNTIYFGRGAYGIEEASKKYFGHPASELTLSESALLAGIIPAPSAWDPAVDPDQAKARWERVLNLMVEDGYISAEDASAAKFPETIDEASSTSMSGTKGYLLQQIRVELARDAGLSDEEIDSGGLRVVSTIDKDMQAAAEKAVASIPEGHSPNLRVALSAVNPENGEVYAAYGGADYQERQQNAVTQDRAMAGSTFKPFGLLAYIEAGGSIDDMYNGNSPLEVTDPRTGETAEVTNFADMSYGYVTMLRATALSINSAYALMNVEVGPEQTRQTAIKLGLPEDTPSLGDEMFNVLGSASPHNLDLTRAYATLASGGIRTTPHFVREVSNGNSSSVIYSAPTSGERVVEAADISAIMPALEATAEWGSAEKASALGRPVAAKTGSSEDNRSAQFAGFIPQMATVVSMYQPSEDGMSEESITPFGGEESITGSTWPGSVWRDFMLAATEKLEVRDFEWFTPQSRISSFDTYTPEPEPSPTPTPEPSQTPSQQPEPTATAPEEGDGEGEDGDGGRDWNDYPVWPGDPDPSEPARPQRPR